MATDAVDAARDQLLPLLAALDTRLRAEANDTTPAADEGPRAFFGQVRRAIEQARVAEDLMRPFMQLSTTAFRGFAFGPESTVVIDRILETAQLISFALSTDDATRH